MKTKTLATMFGLAAFVATSTVSHLAYAQDSGFTDKAADAGAKAKKSGSSSSYIGVMLPTLRQGAKAKKSGSSSAQPVKKDADKPK